MKLFFKNGKVDEKTRVNDKFMKPSKELVLRDNDRIEVKTKIGSWGK